MRGSMKMNLLAVMAVAILSAVSCADRNSGGQVEARKCKTLVVQKGSSILESKYSATLDAQLLVVQDRFDGIQGSIRLYHALGGGID